MSLEDLTAEWASAPPDANARRRLIAAVADLARGLHDAGINHRDLYICHFLLNPESWPAAPELTLIDLHRAEVRAEVPRRWLVKDLGALLFSVLELGLARGDLLRFVRRYTQHSLREEFTTPARQAFWADVQTRAAALHSKGVRKGLV